MTWRLKDLKDMDPEALERGWTVTQALQKKIRSGAIEIETDHYGGLSSGTPLGEFVNDILLLSYLDYQDEELAEAVNGTKPSAPLPIKFRVSYSACFNCAHNPKWVFDGLVIRSVGEPCAYPDGVPAYSMELDCPSGRLVIGNNFRDLYSLPDGISGKLGGDGPIYTKRVFDNYARVGMAHGFVGNTCPGVYQHSDTKVGIWTTDDESDPSMERERVGGICTDLWWYCVVDADDFVERGGVTGIHDTVVTVKPGRYRVTHKYQTHSDPWDSPRGESQDYAIVERVGEVANVH